MPSEFDTLDVRSDFRLSRERRRRKSYLSQFAVAVTVAASFAGVCRDPDSIAVIQFWMLLFIGAALSASSAALAKPVD